MVAGGTAYGAIARQYRVVKQQLAQFPPFRSMQIVFWIGYFWKSRGNLWKETRTRHFGDFRKTSQKKEQHSRKQINDPLSVHKNGLIRLTLPSDGLS